MCLGIPMEVRAIEGHTARCVVRGVERDVSLFLLQGEGVAPGDHVLVHVGYAIQKLQEDEAAATFAALDEFFEDEVTDDGARPSLDAAEPGNALRRPDAPGADRP